MAGYDAKLQARRSAIWRCCYLLLATLSLASHASGFVTTRQYTLDEWTEHHCQNGTTDNWIVEYAKFHRAHRNDKDAKFITYVSRTTGQALKGVYEQKLACELGQTWHALCCPASQP